MLLCSIVKRSKVRSERVIGKMGLNLCYALGVASEYFGWTTTQEITLRVFQAL